MLGDAKAFRATLDAMCEPWLHDKPDKVAGLEARGFILGGAIAALLGVGFVPMRKKGKLPHHTIRAAYALEYGTDELEMHVDAVKPGERVLVVVDLIATGGTAGAALELLAKVDAKVIGASFIIDLRDLGGSNKLRAKGLEVHAILE